mmetsp:Transcript_11062/g.22041  ORF Transcript_11062/g.22041 Transcript_11062/m.22041 type:complete len:80 (+) Transcript_11062:108-347(+)
MTKNILYVAEELTCAKTKSDDRGVNGLREPRGAFLTFRRPPALRQQAPLLKGTVRPPLVFSSSRADVCFHACMTSLAAQ